MFSEKSFNFRLILTDAYILSADFTPFTLLYFTKEISRLMTQEREIKPDGKDENYTLMAKTKGRWQNLKVFEFQRKKTANWLRRISFLQNPNKAIKLKVIKYKIEIQKI
jgi:hypothetical protein